jgi:hypothetical protein
LFLLQGILFYLHSHRVLGKRIKISNDNNIFLEQTNDIILPISFEVKNNIRNFFISAFASTSVVLSTNIAIANAESGNSKPIRSERPLVYSVEFTDPPCLQPRTKQGENGVIEKFIKANIILLGFLFKTELENEKLNFSKRWTSWFSTI